MQTAAINRVQEQPLTPLQQEDRRIAEMLMELHAKGKELTEDEKILRDGLRDELMVKSLFEGGGMANAHADHDRRNLIERVGAELRDEFGSETASKKLLVERLTAAYSMAISYERLFRTLKYTFDEKGDMKYMGFLHNVMREVRMGIKTANEEMVRFTQALNDLKRPPLTVKAQNAFFAQNQQVNQNAEPPKDLEDERFAMSHHAPHSRNVSKAARP